MMLHYRSERISFRCFEVISVITIFLFEVWEFWRYLHCIYDSTLPYLTLNIFNIPKTGFVQHCILKIGLLFQALENIVWYLMMFNGNFNWLKELRNPPPFKTDNHWYQIYAHMYMSVYMSLFCVRVCVYLYPCVTEYLYVFGRCVYLCICMHLCFCADEIDRMTGTRTGSWKFLDFKPEIWDHLENLIKRLLINQCFSLVPLLSGRLSYLRENDWWWAMCIMCLVSRHNSLVTRFRQMLLTSDQQLIG